MKAHHTLLCVMSLLGYTAYASDTIDDSYLAFLQARGETPWINAGADHLLANTAYRPIPPLASFPADPIKRDLGFALFHDATLSKDGTVACNTCHQGMRGATDNKPLSQGINGATGSRNTPTVFNAAFNFRQFWDGRSFDLSEQSLAPLTDPVEMGHDMGAILQLLQQSPSYASKFAAAYPDGITEANLGNAIAQHTKDMTRTDSPFNDYLSGSKKTLSEAAQRGWERFNATGCVSCHNGINMGGNSYQRLGNTEPFLAALPAASAADQGLYSRTLREEDRLVFKVPSLHNVAITAPYYHDGSVATLEEAVLRMGKEQAGRTLSDEDVSDIVTFLESLSSEFFSRRAGAMSAQQLQSEMRQQMPDMNTHQHADPMQGHDHHQHMMQMQNHSHHGGH